MIMLPAAVTAARALMMALRARKAAMAADALGAAPGAMIAPIGVEPALPAVAAAALRKRLPPGPNDPDLDIQRIPGPARAAGAPQ